MDAATRELDGRPLAAPTAPPAVGPYPTRPLPPYGFGGPHPDTTPLAPPQIPRRDSWTANAWAPPSPSGPPAPTPAPAPAPAVKPTPGWGWRALVAFVAGGLLTGGGFTAARLTTTSETATVGSAATAEGTPTTVAPPVAAAPPVTADPNLEPAAFVAQVLGPSVVQIETNFGSGSGVIYDDNLIMTNNHVIDGARSITVVLADGRHLQGELVGGDPNFDIAVVRVDAAENLTQATLATDQPAQVGQIAIAIGAPFKLQQTVTEGIVSAINRPVPSGRIYTAMIQTDAPINPGNSGGALADRQGRVIGINTAIRTDGVSSTNAGIGFAVPIDQALSVANRLVAGQPIESGLLGVEGQAAQDGSAGVVVTAVTPGSAAEAAGVQVGDLIISMDGAPVIALEELAGLVAAREPGEVVELELVRAGQTIQVTATLGAR